MPGRAPGLDGGADALQAGEDGPSQASATPTGSAGISARPGHRASASPSRIPGTTPATSAAADTSPTSCLAPRFRGKRSRSLRQR